MKYCSRCGNELTEKDVFCSKCGAKASRYAVDSLDKKPDAGKTEKHAALIGESVPGARYTAAVEKNAIGVTEYLRRAADLELMRYGINRIGWSLELKEAETVKKVEAEDEALKTFREKEENVEKRINDYQKREYREKVYSFTPKPEPKMLGIVFGGFILLYIILLIAKLDWGILKFPGTLIFVVLLPVLTILGIEIYKYISGKAEHARLEEEAKAAYEEEQNKIMESTLELLNNDLMDYQRIIAEHEKTKKDLQNIDLSEIEAEIIMNNKEKKATEEMLDKFYAPQALNGEYRSLVPVATLYEYFKTGKVKDLTSGDGAYRVYKKELAEGIVTNDLQELYARFAGKGKTDDLQYAVYDKVKSYDDLAINLMNSLDEAIKKSHESEGDLKISREMNSFYRGMAKNRESHKEYVDNVDTYSRNWF